MRPETKERADTIIGSVLRGSFTFYQATAGDMRGREGEIEPREEGRKSWRSGEAALKKHVSFKSANMISLVELNHSRWRQIFFFLVKAALINSIIT